MCRTNIHKVFTLNEKQWTPIFYEVMRSFTKKQLPISSLEIKEAIRKITGPNIQVTQNDVSNHLSYSYWNDKNNTKLGWFDLYSSKLEMSPDGRHEFIRYFVQKPLGFWGRIRKTFA